MNDSLHLKENNNTKKHDIWKFLSNRLGLHSIEYSVPKHAQSLPYILGGLSLTAFAILFATGFYLAQFYNPNQILSNSSVFSIISSVPFGNFARSVHFWTANILFGLILLHMIRVFITGSYKRPREFNWLAGLGLLGITMGFLFTGTMLSLGQEGIEALQHTGEIGALLGSLGIWFTTGFSAIIPFIGRIYIMHISILAILFVLFIIVHFYLIKTHGISPKAKTNATVDDINNEKTNKFTEHLKKLAGWSFILLAIIFILSLIFPESLSSPGLAGVEMTKPPWMFLWIYGMEDIFGITSLIWGPALLFVLLGAIPFIDRSPFLSPRRRPWIMIFGATIIIALIGFSIKAISAPVGSKISKSNNINIVSELFSIPIAYAHNMPSLSFSPSTITRGQIITIIGDGLKTDGIYNIYLKNSKVMIELGKANVVQGEDSFYVKLKIPPNLLGGMYSVETKSIRNKKFDFFSSLQLYVQPVIAIQAPKIPIYAKYPIPKKEIPWIIGLIIISLGLGIFLVTKKKF